MSEENIFAAMLREHAQKMDMECAPEESDFWAAADHIYLLERQLYASKARLSEAVKVLERLDEGERSDEGHTALHDAAKAFIATLGENKNDQ